MNYHKFYRIAAAFASMSKDPSTKVGAVAVNEDGIILSAGYNGFPRGVEDLPERYNDRSIKYKLVAHAEQNLVAQAAYSGHSLKGATVILSGLFPCSSCAKSLIQAGIVRIIAPPSRNDAVWGEDAVFSKILFLESGVETIVYQETEL
jgi:dCMP deaminase